MNEDRIAKELVNLTYRDGHGSYVHLPVGVVNAALPHLGGNRGYWGRGENDALAAVQSLLETVLAPAIARALKAAHDEQMVPKAEVASIWLRMKNLAEELERKLQ